MKISIREHFIEMWEKYFGHAELPVTCYYSDSDMNVKIVGKPSGHSCLLAQLTSVRRGESLCFQEESVNCGGGKRYLGFAEQISNRFEYFLSNGEDGGVCERYKQSPGLVRSLLKSLPRLDIPGKNLIFKRWDKLEESDNPQVITFFVTPDVLSGLFTLANFDNNELDSVIAPFGAGCTSIIYYPFREFLQHGQRAVIGLFDPSARKCVKENILTFSMPIGRFMTLMEEMEQSFLITPSWDILRKRINT